MKKKILIGAGVALAVIVLIVALCLIFEADPMLSQPMENVVDVTITKNPAGKPSAEELELGAPDLSQSVSFPGKADMYTAYYILDNCTRRRNVSKLPSEDFVPEFEIILTYQDGAQDRIFGDKIAEDGKIYRCLNPEVPAEEQKFVRAKCKPLANYINISM